MTNQTIANEIRKGNLNGVIEGVCKWSVNKWGGKQLQNVSMYDLEHIASHVEENSIYNQERTWELSLNAVWGEDQWVFPTRG